MLTLYREDFTGNAVGFRDPKTGEFFNEVETIWGWVPFWREDVRETILKPTMQILDAVDPYLRPQRTNGLCGVRVSRQLARHDAGYWKQFCVPDGAGLVQAVAWGHHWYSERDNPFLSEYEDESGTWHAFVTGDPGAMLMVGLDTTGKVDPWADTVKWGTLNVYDRFTPVTVETEDVSPLVTVFIRSTQQYPLLHVEAFWSNVEVNINGEHYTHPVRRWQIRETME